MYSAHKCQVLAGRGLKTMTNFKIVTPHGGKGSLREVPTAELSLGKSLCFGSVAALERWSLIEG